jgi:hypothetical protein
VYYNLIFFRYTDSYKPNNLEKHDIRIQIMVDSEESGGASPGHLVDIKEDNEYFLKMWNLIPPLVNAELEPDLDDNGK